MADAIISGNSVLNDSRKDLAKEVKMDLARFIWELLGVLILNCLRQWCFKRMLSWDCGATETAGGVEAVQVLVDAVKQGFSDSRVEADSLDGPWFCYANGQWSRALSRVWLLTPMGWTSIYTLEAENVPVLAGMILLENHDISFRRNEFLVCDAEGHARSVPLRRSPTGHRILNLLYIRDSAPRRVSLTRQQMTSLKIRDNRI